MRRATRASSRTGRTMPRAIIKLATIDTTMASTEINASWRCKRRNGSSAEDSGCCSTAMADSPGRDGSARTRVSEASS